MTEEEIKGWVNKRKFLKGRITNLEKSVENIDAINSISDLELVLDRLNDFFKKFEDIEINLESVDEAKYKAENLSIETRYYDLSKKIRRAMEKLKDRRRTASLNDSFSRSDNQALSLPKINLPTFSGEYTGWLNFKDLFTNLIHNNSELPNIRKFYYLKGAVKSDAAKLIASIECSDANYSKAWDTMVKRFDNKVLIANSHLKGIFDLQKVNKTSGIGLRAFVNDFTQHYNALKSLELSSLFDVFLVYLLSQKLDFESHRELELKRKHDEFPTIDSFIEFLNQRCQAWEILSQDYSPKLHNASKHEKKSISCTTIEPQSNSNLNRCPYCSRPHSLVKCYKYLKLDVKRRRQFVKSKQLCFNCLNSNHQTEKCPQSVCKRCLQNHHWSLHGVPNQLNERKESRGQVDTSSDVLSTNTISRPEPQEGIASCSSLSFISKVNNYQQHTILLSTAIVNVVADNGSKLACRALLDSASERNFVSAIVLKKLDIPVRHTNWLVMGVGGSNTPVNSVVSLNIEYRTTNFQFKAEFGVLENTTDNLPKRSFKKQLIKWPSFINLADPNFNLSGPIDMLIGTSLFYKFLKKGKIDLGQNSPTLQNTSLGWILGGNINLQKEFNSVNENTFTSLVTTTNNINEIMTGFWKLEEYSSKPIRSAEEKLCEKLFLESVSRDSDGRYEVDLPIFMDRINTLGDSYNFACRCFLSLERKFAKNPEFFEKYKTFINEFLSLGHGTEIKRFPEHLSDKHEYYMPHHAVLKDSSSTTKLRVVFNASAPSSTGVSLNDIMLVGPVVQSDLLTVLIRFRCFIVAIISDIAMMYRQIKVKDNFQSLQRILWRDSPEENIRCLQLSRVTYGTASASFLATRCLLKLVEDEGSSFRLASRAIELNSYVDDILTGAEDFDKAFRLQDELISLLEKRQFKLHKWYSNYENVLDRIPEENREKCSFQFSDGCSSIKTLGLVWNPGIDAFQILVPDDLMESKVTKREILSSIAKLFDPLGLMAPACVSAKIIMQMIWRSKVEWDDKVPNDILELWIPLKGKLFELRKLTIPRLILISHAVRFELHGFSDSSTKAYGCAIYLKSVDSNGYFLVRLICAKSRVAPIKPISLPRLELCACVLSARFMKTVRQALTVKIEQAYFWTDSMIALAWIRSEASRWNVFVANRVSEIQELCPEDHWNHVISSENPADVVSRGIDPSLLGAHELWWNGPTWLALDKKCWPTGGNINDIPDPPEAKPKACSSHISQCKDNDILMWFETFSCFYRLQRSFAYVLRFCFNVKLVNKGCRRSEFLKVSELTESFNGIFRIVQQEYFSNEIMLLNKVKDDLNYVPNLKSSKLKFLNPFIDKEGILRIIHIRQTFWKRWGSEYLNTLQQRSKWLQKTSNIKEDTLVLIKDDNAPPSHWPLAKVMEVIKSRDGLVRSIRLKTKDGNSYVRPITKVCPLPVD
ncbi:uncharacterized protein LOC123302922 [Chrysoperla carnea]|uniref:uncharacterized protein LOC123302922 n=1 Tax=Chrysoperla carnea TaxID=189513 RepID=UPI001D05F805|nr:uncharacterized protein LOC123302922 [Chrysoperla carnea]